MKFRIAENLYSGRRVSFADGRIVVEDRRRGNLTVEQKKLVETAHLDPLEKLHRVEALVKSGKVDAKALEAILNERPDLDSLVS